MFGAAFHLLCGELSSFAAVDGLSIRETAKVMEVSHGTVKARLARARPNLKQMVRKSVGNEGVVAFPRTSSR